MGARWSPGVALGALLVAGGAGAASGCANKRLQADIERAVAAAYRPTPDSAALGRAASDSAAWARDAASGPAMPEAPAHRVAYADSLRQPESARYDSTLDVWFVSNVNGPPQAKDDNGFITRLGPDGAVSERRFVEGGKNGVTLHAPKGIAIVGDTLWVADLDAVRGFDRHSGKPVATVELAAQGATFLNDLAAGPDGTLWVTDEGIVRDSSGAVSRRGPFRLYRIGARRAVAVALETPALREPNGVAWDARAGRLVVAPFGGDSLLAWTPGTPALSALAGGAGQFGGLAFAADGRLFVSSLATSAVHELRDGRLTTLIEHLPSPANIGYDARHRRLAVPLRSENRVEIWAVR